MIKKQVTPAEVVVLLNELTALDRDAMHALVETRVHCNLALADHPTVQVSSRKEGDGSEFEVGFLGVLNGIFGADEIGWGAIVAVFDENTLTGFVVRPRDVRVSLTPTEP